VDCGGITVGTSCPGDGEGQPPVFTLNNATIKNVRIAAAGGGDGIHCKSGNCVIQNVVWEDICEDAASNLSEGGSLTIIGGSAYNSNSSGYGGTPDKIFQHNSKNSTTYIQGGFTAKGQNGKLWRSCGDCTNNGGPRHVNVNNVRIEGSIGSVVGPNGNYGDTATIRNLQIQGYKAGSPKVCVEYVGVQKGSGSSSSLGEKWNTSVCKVSTADIIPF
jgi:pectate lyase